MRKIYFLKHYLYFSNKLIIRNITKKFYIMNKIDVKVREIDKKNRKLI